MGQPMKQATGSWQGATGKRGSWSLGAGREGTWVQDKEPEEGLS